MSIVFTMDPKELKGAMSSIDALSKKVPNDVAAGDASIAFVLINDEMHLISVHDHFSADVLLPSVKFVGESSDLVSWDGNNSLDESSVIGIYERAKLLSLLTKLSAKEAKIVVSDDKRHMNLYIGSTQSYELSLASPRKILANYTKSSSYEEIISASSEEFEWFCSTLTSLSKIVKPSVSAPAFGCIIMNAELTKQRALTLSGNSDSEGYSLIYSSHILSKYDFSALLPKKLCEGMSAFLSKLKISEGDVSISASLDEQNKATKIFFSSPSFSLSLSCMKDRFPFEALDRIVASANEPYCVYETDKTELKSSIDRLAVFSEGDDSLTEINVLDGGSVEMMEKKRFSKNIPAREVCSKGDLINFPEKIPSLGTSVNTQVLKSLVNLSPKTHPVRLVVCRSQNDAPRRLALISKDEFSNITAVLLGIRNQ